MSAATRNGAGIMAHVALTVAATALTVSLLVRDGATTTQLLFITAGVLACCAALFVAFSFWRSGSSQAAIRSSMMGSGFVAMVGAALSKDLMVTALLGGLSMPLYWSHHRICSPGAIAMAQSA